MKSISPKELNNLINSKSNDFQLIDIREEYEHGICCIGGDKINMYQIPDKVSEISKEKKVIIYCRTGARSANVVTILEKNFNFQNVYNLDGGIMKWREDVDPTLNEY